MSKNPATVDNGFSRRLPPIVLTPAEPKHVAGGDAGPAPYNKNGGEPNGPIRSNDGDFPKGDFAE